MIARVLTCQGREEDFAATLSQFRHSDWDADPIVQIDASAGTRLERINLNWRVALEATARDGATTLIVEDDVEINANLRRNLERWAPIGRQLLFGSLYNGAAPAQLTHGPAFFLADAAGMWGSQAIVVSPAMASHILAHWGEEDGFADTRMPRLAARLGPVYCHVPSLIQHVGTRSTWGGPFHKAADFDAAWRAP